jgi:hypothetical protein
MSLSGLTFSALLLALLSTAAAAVNAADDCDSREDCADDANSLLSIALQTSRTKMPKVSPQPCDFQRSIVPGGDELFVTTTFHVTDAEAYKQTMKTLLPKIQSTEPDTWSFTAWLSKDGTYGSTWEQYKNNAAIKGLRLEINAVTKDYRAWTILGPASDATKEAFEWNYASMSNLITGYRRQVNVPDFTKTLINMVRADISSMTHFQAFAKKCAPLESHATLYGIYQSEDGKRNGFLEFFANAQDGTDQLSEDLFTCYGNLGKIEQEADPDCLSRQDCGNGMQTPNTVPKVFMGPEGYFSDTYNITGSGGGYFGQQPFLFSLPESFMRC